MQSEDVHLRKAGTRSFILWTATVLLTLGLAGGVAEVVARLAHLQAFRVKQSAYIGWAQRDPVLGWRNNPGVYPSNEGDHQLMTFLPDGSRATGAPEGRDTSILILGCSFSSGYGVRDQETYSALLQQRFPDERVRNFAVSGYGTYQSLLLLKELVEQRGYRPRLVIYPFMGMHPGRNVLTYGMLESFRAYGGQRFPPPHVELHDGKLTKFPPYVVPNWPLEQHSAFISLLHATALRNALAGHERYQVEVTRQLIQQMKQVSEGAGARFVVVTLWNGKAPWGRFPTKQVTDAIHQDGIEEFDITYDGPETRVEKLVVGGNGHPGPIIHQWWADRIGDWLTRERAAVR
ncbi:MAG: hypothetical protein WBW33_29830 [Bryobacteraceae bacterium]